MSQIRHTLLPQPGKRFLRPSLGFCVAPLERFSQVGVIYGAFSSSCLTCFLLHIFPELRSECFILRQFLLLLHKLAGVILFLGDSLIDLRLCTEHGFLDLIPLATQFLHPLLQLVFLFLPGVHIPLLQLFNLSGERIDLTPGLGKFLFLLHPSQIDGRFQRQHLKPQNLVGGSTYFQQRFQFFLQLPDLLLQKTDPLTAAHLTDISKPGVMLRIDMLEFESAVQLTGSCDSHILLPQFVDRLTFDHTAHEKVHICPHRFIFCLDFLRQCPGTYLPALF